MRAFSNSLRCTGLSGRQRGFCRVGPSTRWAGSADGAKLASMNRVVWATRLPSASRRSSRWSTPLSVPSLARSTSQGHSTMRGPPISPLPLSGRASVAPWPENVTTRWSSSLIASESSRAFSRILARVARSTGSPCGGSVSSVIGTLAFPNSSQSTFRHRVASRTPWIPRCGKFSYVLTPMSSARSVAIVALRCPQDGALRHYNTFQRLTGSYTRKLCAERGRPTLGDPVPCRGGQPARSAETSGATVRGGWGAANAMASTPNPRRPMP